MTSIIETIKAKIDVVEEISLVVSLQKSGKSYKGLCPFHNERTPSFYVFPESQTWRCFGCHEGGDVFSFVEKQQSIEFRDSLVYLAEKAGVALEEYTNRDPEVEREANAVKQRLRKLNEDALLWFHQMLLRSKDATEARAYVQSRGISSDSVIAFSLGYAPEHQDGLCRYLLGQGYTVRELVSGGLAREREEAKGGGVYDYFRHRLIFPIRDMRSRVIGFGGRALGDGQPKYLNSPQTLLFEKNNVLYALDMAREAVKSAKQVIIVEGYVDAIIAHQYGTKQTVACIGSAITEKHIQQLKKLTKQVTLALDPDAAGATATEHGIQEALKSFDRTVVPVPLAAGARASGRNRSNSPRGMIQLEEQVDAEINVLQLPAGEDPDEVIRRDFSLWSYAVSHPLPLVDYYFVAKTAGLNLREPGGKTEAAKRLLPVIGMISDRIKRDAYIRKLATMISIEERSLYDELQRVLKGQKTTSVVAQYSEPMGRNALKGDRRVTDNPFGSRPSAAIKTPSLLNSTPAAPTMDGEGGGSAEGSSPVNGSGWISLEEENEQRQEEKRREVVGGLDKRKSSKLQWEDYLIGLLLQNPGLSLHVCGIINGGDFAGTDTRELYHILNSVNERGSSSSNQPFEQLVPSALLATIARARKCVELGTPLDGAGQIKFAVQCATRLKRASLLQLNTELRFLMDEAKKTGDVVSAQQIQQQMSAVQQQLRTLYSAMRLHG